MNVVFVNKTILIILLILLAGIGGFGAYRISKLDRQVALLEHKLGGTEKISCSVEETTERVKRSVVRVVGGFSEGSGFVIDSSGPHSSLIATNFHVIEFEPSPKIVLPDNSFETASVVFVHKNADLAILQIPRPLPHLPWGKPGELTPGEELFAVGFPFGGDISGEASVTGSILSGRRSFPEEGLKYLQIDGTINPGMSGGPLVDTCGRVVGINTSGTSGLGMAISSDSFREAWLVMASTPELAEDIRKVTFEPEKSPVECVAAFYNYLKIRKMPEAYALLSANHLQGADFDYWQLGYWNVLDTTAFVVQPVVGEENKVFVKLTSKDLVGDEIEYKYFEGTWEVRQVDGRWQLWESEIKKVENPSWEWFYSPDS